MTTASAPKPTPKPASTPQEMRMPVYVFRSEEWQALSPGAQHLWTCKARYATERDGVYTCWLTQRRAAAMTGAWRTSIYAWEAELEKAGWQKPFLRFDRQRRPLAMGYELLFPGSAGECHAHVQRMIRGEDAAPGPLFETGDVFTYEGKTIIRCARIAGDLLASREMAQLRVASGLAFSFVILLSAHTGHGRQGPQRASRSRIAEWLGCSLGHVSRVTQAAVDGGWVGLHKRQRGDGRAENAWSLDLGRAVTAWSSERRAEDVRAAHPDWDDKQVRRASGFGWAPTPTPPAMLKPDAPPQELLDELFAQRPDLAWRAKELDGEELWRLCRELALVEDEEPPRGPPEPLLDHAKRYVRAFHQVWRGPAAEHYAPRPKEVVEASRRLARPDPEAAWKALAYAVAHLRRTKANPGDIGMAWPLVDEALAAALSHP